MADSDRRVEVLEEELKLLKGEVKRTLVDLRAFVMREDSPLNERLEVAPAINETSVSERVIKETTVDGESERRVDALEDELRVMRIEKAASSSQQASPAAQAPQQQAPAPQQPWPVPAYIPPPQQVMGYPPPPVAAQAPPPQNEPANRAPDRDIPDHSSNGISQDLSDNGRSSEPTEYNTLLDETKVQWKEERHETPEPIKPSTRKRQEERSQERPPSSSERKRRRPTVEKETKRQPSVRQITRSYSGEILPDPSERRRIPSMNGKSVEQEVMEDTYDWEYEDESEENGWVLPSDDPEQHVDQPTASYEFLDVNLIANLVRWALQAKARMGQAKLSHLLEVYLRSGHCSKELSEIISYVCNMVEDEPSCGIDPAQEYMELIHQLDGILIAGGIFSVDRPRVRVGGSANGRIR